MHIVDPEMGAVYQTNCWLQGQQEVQLLVNTWHKWLIKFYLDLFFFMIPTIHQVG
jgi:hypothetical protein